MSFIDQLAGSEGLLERVTARRDADLDCLRDYVVDDIVDRPRPPKGILLCESPHVDEVTQHCPLAGASGRDVTWALGEALGIPEGHRSTPFGEALNLVALHNLPGLDEIGIMNVCNVPLQSRPYSAEVRACFGPLLRRFKTIRDGPATGFRRDVTTGEIEQLIVGCLRDRIVAAPGDACFILCGAVAEALFRKATNGVLAGYRIIEVPHPSRGNWKKQRHRACIEQIKGEIQRRSGLQ